MKKHGFKKVGDWYFNSKEKLDVDFPSSINDTIGLIAMTIDEEAVFLSSTTHYGPRIKDFKHSKTGKTGDAKIHHLIEENLTNGKIVTVWVKNTTTPCDEKNDLLKALNPIWNK